MGFDVLHHGIKIDAAVPADECAGFLRMIRLAKQEHDFDTRIRRYLDLGAQGTAGVQSCACGFGERCVAAQGGGR